MQAATPFGLGLSAIASPCSRCHARTPIIEYDPLDRVWQRHCLSCGQDVPIPTVPNAPATKPKPRAPTRAEARAEAIAFRATIQDQEEQRAARERFTGILAPWAEDANWQAWRTGQRIGEAPTQVEALELLTPREQRTELARQRSEALELFRRAATSGP